MRPRTSTGSKGRALNSENASEGRGVERAEARLLAALRATLARASNSDLYAERLRTFELRSLEDMRRLPLTTREDLQAAGLDGTRAVPLKEVSHYGESSGTSGASNSTWLTAEDLARSSRAITARHPDVFAPGRILLNRFPFMAAPAHLIQLIAQQGGGVSIPAGNINWDVPFPRALDLARKTGAQVLAGLPMEPIILEQLAKQRGLDPAKDLAIDTFFLGGAALPPIMQQRIERIWGARVIELYGSTETMLLGTGCEARSLHLETDLVYCEVLQVDSDEPAEVGEEGRLIVTTIGIDGSPLIRLDTEDRVRQLSPCSCGDPRPRLIVLGRESDIVELAGQRLHSYEIIEAAAAAADVLDSSVFFTVVLPDRLVIRIESERVSGDPTAAAMQFLPRVRLEIERTPPNTLLDVENLSRSPSVYKPVLVSDWRKEGRQVLSVSQGMIEWPRPSLGEMGRMLTRMVRGSLRAREFRRSLKVAKKSSQ